MSTAAIDHAPASAAGLLRHSWARVQRSALPLLAIAIVLGIWQAISEMTWLGLWVDYISSPAAAASAGWTMATSGELWTNARGSLVAFAIGFVLSAGVGIPIGLVMGWSRTIRELLEAPLYALNATPRLALLPVIVVWLGIDVASVVAVVFIDAVIPVIVNAMAGVREVDASLLRVGRSFGATRLQLFRKIIFPASTPAVLTGVRLAVARGVLGVIVAQLYVSTVGIGHLIATYGQLFQVDQIVFLVVLVAVVAYLVNLALERLQSRFDRWRGEP